VKYNEQFVATTDGATNLIDAAYTETERATLDT
jgi:hypothetical protein